MKTLTLLLLAFVCRGQILTVPFTYSASSGPLAAPTFTPVSGTSNPGTVTINCAVGATCCYNFTGNPSAAVAGTCDGGSTTYTSPVTVSASEIFTALATQAGHTNSSPASASYTVGMSMIDGTYGATGAAATTISTSTHALTVLSSDYLWCAVVSDYSSSCGSITLSDTGSANTFTQVGSNVSNNYVGGHCIAQFTAANAVAVSSDTITAAVPNNSANATVVCAQIRGTANAAPDQTASCDANTAGGPNLCVGPRTSGNGVAASSNITTTHAPALVLAASSAANGTTITPTSNGCFGVTATNIPNTQSGTVQMNVQYTILSSTQTGYCEATPGSSTTMIQTDAVIH